MNDTVVETGELFDGLVGPSCEIDASLEGIFCKRLLDSGSQVTTIGRSFFKNKLATNIRVQC